MNITIYFRGLGYYDVFQAKVLLYDSNGSLLYQGYTYNGEISLCLERDQVYQIKAFSCQEMIQSAFYVDSSCQSYRFYFPRSICKSRLITFLLTDSYYENLPIEKGVIYLE